MASKDEAMETPASSPSNSSESNSLIVLQAEFQNRDDSVSQKIMLKEVNSQVGSVPWDWTGVLGSDRPIRYSVDGGTLLFLVTVSLLPWAMYI